MSTKAIHDARCRMQGAKWAVLLASTLWLLPLGFAAEIDNLIKAAPGREAYPEAGALILLDRRVVTIDKNNRATTERYLVVKIFEDRGRDEFGDITQKFNRDGQVVEVLEARTHKPDGTMAKPEARAISDVSAPEVFDAMAYTNAMLKVVSFPALEKDAVIEYRVRVKPKRGTREDGFSGVVRFGGFYPALKREFELIVPEGVSFRHDWTREEDAVQPQTRALPGKRTSYVWQINSTPQITEEPGMPSLARLVPVLVYSSYRDWTQVAEKLKQEFDQGLTQSPEVKRLADSLTAGPLSRGPAPRDPGLAARAIFLYVTQKFRSIRLDYGDAGYDAHKPDQILQWKYGDCRDKNCLLISLLRAAGFDAFPVIVSRTLPVVKSVPCPDVFDWLATMAYVPTGTAGQTAVDNRQSPLFLDPFAEYHLYGTIPSDQAGREALVLDGESAQLSAVPPKGDAQTDLAITRAELSLSATGDLAGTVLTEVGGYYDARIRANWRDQTLSDRKRAMAQTASSIKTGAQIDTFWFSDLNDLTQPVTAGFRFSAPRYAVTQKGELSLRMASPAIAGEPLFGIVASGRRTNPVESRPRREYTYLCNLKLPPGVKVDLLPDSVAVTDVGLSTQGAWSKTADGVSFAYAVRVEKELYAVNEFPKLKAGLDALNRAQFREVYFLK